MQNTDSFADNVTIVTTTTIFVNFANKFIPVQLTQMMTINGLDVTLAVDGIILNVRRSSEIKISMRSKIKTLNIYV